MFVFFAYKIAGNYLQITSLLLIADKAGINLEEAARAKLEKNAVNYPVEKSYGSSRKYTQLED